MLASIQKVEGGYVARFDRPLNHSVEKVWAALTENDKLARWMPNLQVEDLRQGGTIKFDMKDGTGTFIDIEITDFQKNSVLEFTWANDRVRFEIYPKPDGLSALMDGHFMDFPTEEWQKWHEKYVEAVKQIQNI